MNDLDSKSAAIGIRFPELTPTELAHEHRFTVSVAIATLLVGVIGAVTFLVNPTLDLDLMTMLRMDDGFILRDSDGWKFLRRAIMWGFGAFYVFTIVATIASWRSLWPFSGLYAIQWLYLVICSLLGPLLVANVWLKENVARPRPDAVEFFGGEHEFIGAFRSGGKCLENCSFVSGEVSSMAMIFASLMFVGGRFRILFATLLLVMWAFSAFMRMGAGRHFPSDTFFAGIFMMVIAAAAYWFLFLFRRK